MFLQVNNLNMLQNNSKNQPNIILGSNSVVTTHKLEKTPSPYSLIKSTQNETKETLLTLCAIASIGLVTAGVLFKRLNPKSVKQLTGNIQSIKTNNESLVNLSNKANGKVLLPKSIEVCKLPKEVAGKYNLSPEPINGLHFAPREVGDTVCFSRESWRRLVPNLQEKINSKNFLGSGGEASVYAINDSYVLRMYGGHKTINSEFLPVKDIFEGRNFGQAIARTKEGISINRRVHGVPLYKCNDTDPKIYMKNLREYANLSDDTLESFVSDVAFINSKGWRIDQGNPENFLFNKTTGKIGIVDLCKKNSGSLDLFEPYAHDWILAPLVNGHDVFKIYKKLSPVERKELFALIGKLEKRILPLCEKYGIPKAKWNKNDYRRSSLINLLDLKGQINVSKIDDLYEAIIYERYPRLIEKYKIYKEKKKFKN